ncbi:conserved phage C-terminal domain-containing protein [Sporosarcina sp. G11-34]|uniref:conserved phage C-terminal domain-containing protein n=1 Tax=Sporosarcina sp. G11-34 TaxID=2849605 RepID=UPI0022A96161|nr:conserved phage C-terminal domain-containing protein [Sporosarcina sp. G11-34]
MDKTKWYRIDYSKLHGLTMQNAPSTLAHSAVEDTQIAASSDGNLPLAITKELKSNKKEHVENNLDVVSVVDYLNEKTSKQFKASSKATERLVKGRIHEGYKLGDFKKIIDLKAREWLNDLHWQKYLRPSTLFNATHFENYLLESRTRYSQENSSPKPIELNFSEGEE